MIDKKDAPSLNREQRRIKKHKFYGDPQRQNKLKSGFGKGE